MLLSHEARIDAKTNNNETAIMLAVQNGSLTYAFSFTIFLKISSNFSLQAIMMLLMNFLETKLTPAFQKITIKRYWI